MLLIATDEAGYGPKLGPLVIAGTAWRIPGERLAEEDLRELFAPLRVPRTVGDWTVLVDDSKAVYKPAFGLGALHAVVSASLHWCGRAEPSLHEALPKLCPRDFASISSTPWLSTDPEIRLLSRADIDEILKAWKSTGIELVDIQTRVITAGEFNRTCDRGSNKADLLSEASLGLVRKLFDDHVGEDRETTVFCDRHGGRRYYAGVLQHLFPEAALRVLSEQPQRSTYRLGLGDQQIDVHFTVKGDSFTPVALASMHAKYLRERFMGSFNAFFTRHNGSESSLKPTAGYPVDADRFLADIAPILSRERIDQRLLVRSR